MPTGRDGMGPFAREVRATCGFEVLLPALLPRLSVAGVVWVGVSGLLLVWGESGSHLDRRRWTGMMARRGGVPAVRLGCPT